MPTTHKNIGRWVGGGDGEWWWGWRGCSESIPPSPPSHGMCKIVTWLDLLFFMQKQHIFRDCFVYVSSQWEMMLQCNVISHWLGAYTKWSLHIFKRFALRQTVYEISAQWQINASVSWPISLSWVMACCLSSAKSLPEPVLSFCQLDPQEQTSVTFNSKCKSFLSRKYILKCHLQKISSVLLRSQCINNDVQYW